MTRWWRPVLAAVALIIGTLAVVERVVPAPQQRPCQEAEATQGAPTAAAGGEPTTPPAGVTTDVAVLADGDSFPRLVSSVVLRVPTEQPAVEDLLRTSPADLGRPGSTQPLLARNASRAHLAELLIRSPSAPDDFGLFRPTVAGAMIAPIRDAPLVTVADGLATIDLRLPGDRHLSRYPPSADPLGDDVDPPWRVGAIGRDLLFNITGEPHGMTTWSVGFCVEGMRILSASPKPDLHDGSHRLRWTVTDGPRTVSRRRTFSPDSVQERPAKGRPTPARPPDPIRGDAAAPGRKRP